MEVSKELATERYYERLQYIATEYLVHRYMQKGKTKESHAISNLKKFALYSVYYIDMKKIKVLIKRYNTPKKALTHLHCKELCEDLFSKDNVENMLFDYTKDSILTLDANDKTKEYVKIGHLIDALEYALDISIDRYIAGVYQPRLVKCECGVYAQFVDTKVIYKNSKKSYGMAYLCPCCGSYVGCHNGTNIPKGTLADAQTRKYRKYVHYFMEKKWKGIKNTTEQYQWLSEQMHLPKEITHIGMFNTEMCKNALAKISKASSS